jgi:Acyl-CoA synthetases (AMP-forming)/AMP-acid ligases II
MTVVMNAVLFSGGEYWPLPSWDVEQALGVIEEAEISIFHGVPAMYNDIITTDPEGSRDLSSVSLSGVGGAGIPGEVLRQFETLYDTTVYEGYGLTETSPVTHFNRPSAGRRVGSIGKVLTGIQARVVDEDFAEVSPIETGPVEDAELDGITGEIVINGPNVTRGYQDRPKANEASFTEADGKRWFHTGDIGYQDEEGFFFVVDREKHVIVTGGYNVYPREVEELLFEHEAVADAAVVGIPDERRGETVKAFVVSNGDVTKDEIRDYCLSNLAEYKHPREVAFVDELPRTTTGKVQKFELSPNSE